MATTKVTTAEELWELEDDGFRYELIRGRLVKMPPTGEPHGEVLVSLAFYVKGYLQDHPIARVVAGDTGYRLARDPDTVLAPDLAVTRNERIPDDESGGAFPDRAPDLVVEILSPSDRAGMVNEKVAAYLDAGVRLLWLIDPQRHSIMVHAPGLPSRTLYEDDELTASDILPDFRLRVADIFA